MNTDGEAARGGESGSRLTTAERELIARARTLAKGDGPSPLRHYLSQHGPYLDIDRGTDHAILYTAGFGSAQVLLGQLADLAERLGDSSAR